MDRLHHVAIFTARYEATADFYRDEFVAVRNRLLAREACGEAVLRVMGATRMDAIRKVLIPSSLAWVFAGLRISVPFALIGAV